MVTTASATLLALSLLASPGSPQAFLEALYGGYAGDGPGPVFGRGEGGMRRYLSPELAGLIDAATEGPDVRGEVGALDGDPLLNAQEWRLTHLSVEAREVTPGRAEGVVSFRNFDEPSRARVELVKTGEGWRVADVVFDGERPLTEFLRGAVAEDRAYYKAVTPAKDFVAALYALYEGLEPEGIMSLEREGREQWLTLELLDALGRPLAAADGKPLVPAPRGDPIVGAEQWHVSSLKIEGRAVEVEEQGFYRALARVSFTNLGARRSLELDLVRWIEGWKVAEIRYEGKDSLRAALGLGGSRKRTFETVDAFAERFRKAVMLGDREALVAMVEPAGLVLGGPTLASRAALREELKARRGGTWVTLLSTAAERKGAGPGPGFQSYLEFFLAHPSAARWQRSSGGFVSVRWHRGPPELNDPARMKGPELEVVRDFGGRLWVRRLGGPMD